MVKRIKGKILAFSFLFITTPGLPQDGKIFPVPAGNVNQLFYLQRTPNTNTVVYELNYTNNNQLDKANPIHIFWIRHAEKGQHAELSFIQRRFAYGMKIKLLSDNYYELRIVAYKEQVLYLEKAPNNTFRVFTTVNHKQIIINRIYLKINGGSFWSPNVEYVEFTGTDYETGSAVTERLPI